MERGGSSNLEIKYKYSRRHKSGIVIEEPNAAANIPSDDKPQQCFKRDPDQYMPIANVIRIMRGVLPSHAKIADDAKETIQECVSEFISFITNEANAKCHREYRKTVTPEDVLSAMASLGFDNYAEALSVYLNKYRAQDTDHGPMQQAPAFVRRNPPSIVQRPVAQRPRPPPAPTPPAPVMRDYVPLPPAYGVDDAEFPKMIDYFMGSLQGGCSREMEEFDPFK